MSNYDKDIENFSDNEKTLKKYAIEQVVTSGKKPIMHECMLCQRYKNVDPKGTVVHIVKLHSDILKLIHLTR